MDGSCGYLCSKMAVQCSFQMYQEMVEQIKAQPEGGGVTVPGGDELLDISMLEGVDPDGPF